MSSIEYLEKHSIEWQITDHQVMHKSGYWICGMKNGELVINETLETMLKNLGGDYKDYILKKFFKNNEH